MTQSIQEIAGWVMSIMTQSGIWPYIAMFLIISLIGFFVNSIRNR